MRIKPGTDLEKRKYSSNLMMVAATSVQSVSIGMH